MFLSIRFQGPIPDAISPIECAHNSAANPLMFLLTIPIQLIVYHYTILRKCLVKFTVARTVYECSVNEIKHNPSITYFSNGQMGLNCVYNFDHESAPSLYIHNALLTSRASVSCVAYLCVAFII